VSSWVLEILEYHGSSPMNSDKNGFLTIKLGNILIAIVTNFLLIVIALSVEGKKNL
jgi:hypothetical protein